MADIQSRPLRLGEEKKKERRKKKPQGKNIVVCPIPYGDHKKPLVFVPSGLERSLF